jgi:hypothetical protein
MEIASSEGKRQSKRFFFEKKNQKTLTHSGEPLRKGRSQFSKGFLLLFEKKKSVSFIS